MLRVPLLTHHAVVYGHAVHEAVRQHFEARLAGRPFTADDLVAAFRSAWVSEGFLSRDPRGASVSRAGEATLRRFHAEEAEAPWSPTAVEQDFAFDVETQPGAGPLRPRAREGRPRHDRRLQDGRRPRRREGGQKRARESLQLDVYALAYLKTKGRLPDRVELRFLESGLVAGRRPTREEAAETEARIRAAAAAIRRREFPAKPTWMACGQCPFRDICPHTAWGREDEAVQPPD